MGGSRISSLDVHTQTMIEEELGLAVERNFGQTEK
jgi:hypothetical protein